MKVCTFCIKEAHYQDGEYTFYLEIRLTQEFWCNDPNLICVKGLSLFKMMCNADEANAVYLPLIFLSLLKAWNSMRITSGTYISHHETHAPGFKTATDSYTYFVAMQLILWLKSGWHLRLQKPVPYQVKPKTSCPSTGQLLQIHGSPLSIMSLFADWFCKCYVLRFLSSQRLNFFQDTAYHGHCPSHTVSYEFNNDGSFSLTT